MKRYTPEQDKHSNFAEIKRETTVTVKALIAHTHQEKK